MGDAPVHQAAYKGHVEVLRVLRTDPKCDVHLKNGEEKTALDIVTDPESKSEIQKWIQVKSGETRSTSNGDYGSGDYAASDPEEEE